MEGSFPNSKATVEFENEGQKQLLLKFARLQIVK
jgi:DNA helicase-2/ATP-dependent DNA helicase PcrA